MMTTAYYLAHAEEIKARATKWYRDNTERAKASRAAYKKANRTVITAKERAKLRLDPTPERIRGARYRNNHQERVMLRTAKYRAKKKNIPFTIKESDIVIPEFCPVLGIKLIPALGKRGGEPNSPSIDRFTPALGYIPGNIAVISHRANSVKNTGTNRRTQIDRRLDG